MLWWKFYQADFDPFIRELKRCRSKVERQYKTITLGISNGVVDDQTRVTELSAIQADSFSQAVHECIIRGLDPTLDNVTEQWKTLGATSEDVAQARLSLSPAPPRADTSKIKILCVDARHGHIAIIVQAYLELIRAWTANANNIWLFSDVSSAGYEVKSPVSTKHAASTGFVIRPSDQPVPMRRLHEFVQDPKYFESSDGPREKETIIAHMQDQRTKGLRIRDFDFYDYILCFDLRTSQSLAYLRDAVSRSGETNGSQAPGRAKIHCLPDCGYSPLPQWPYTGIRRAVRRFCAEELRWERPRRGFVIGREGWRTVQFFVTSQNAEEIMKNREKLERETRCSIFVGRIGRRTRLVSVVGSADTEQWKVGRDVVKNIHQGE